MCTIASQETPVKPSGRRTYSDCDSGEGGYGHGGQVLGARYIPSLFNCFIGVTSRSHCLGVRSWHALKVHDHTVPLRRPRSELSDELVLCIYTFALSVPCSHSWEVSAVSNLKGSNRSNAVHTRSVLIGSGFSRAQAVRQDRVSVASRHNANNSRRFFQVTCPPTRNTRFSLFGQIQTPRVLPCPFRQIFNVLFFECVLKTPRQVCWVE